MKKIVVVLLSLVVAILVIGGNAFAQDKTPKSSIPEPSLDPEWKLIDRGSDGSTTYFNTKKITHLPKSVVKVWDLVVPRGEFRREIVNILKHNLLSEGKDPNNAERFWYVIYLNKVNCKNNQFASVEEVYYSFGRAVLDDVTFPFQHQKWHNIIPGSVGERLEKYVCK